MNETDEILMEKIVEGDHGAFASLVKKYTHYFYAISYRYVADKATAEDVTQQAFLKLWEAPYMFDSAKGVKFKTWFSKTVVNLCIDHKRKNRNIFVNIEDVQVESDEKSASFKVLEKQAIVLLERGINSLPLSQQTAINLGFYQEIPYDEVAQIMEISPSAVKSLIMRAKENIKKHMEGAATC